MERRKELLFRLLWWAAATGVGWLALRYALVWLLPFLLALGAAALLEPLIETARRRLHLRRSFTAAVLTLVLVGGVLAVLIVLAVQVVEQVQKYFGSKVYKTTIPRSIRISEAPSYGQPINFYEPKGKGSEAYMDLAIEFVKNNRPHEPKKTRARSKSAPEPAPVKNALED